MGGTGTEIYWHTNGTAEDKKVAGILAPKLASQTGLKNRGVKTEKWAVLTCNATAILSEGGFMDTTKDYEVITSDQGQQKYAQAVADTVIEYLGLSRVSSSNSSGSSAPSNSNGEFKVGTYNGNVKVTAADGLNVRSERNASSSIIATLAKDTVIEVGYIMYENNQTSGNSLWGGVVVNGKQGFINLDYVVPVSSSASNGFLVEIICDELNIRKEADFDSPVVGVVKRGEVFTIVEEKNGLGRLKSGTGWISMGTAYVKRK